MKHPLQQYRKRENQFVTAIQLSLQTDGFNYQKWGADQFCKQGDWIVNNNGEIYTVDQAVFNRTYKETDTGRYVKTTPVWAMKTNQPGKIPTKEGESHYQAGDYLVFNNADQTDGYCISPDKFESMYELDHAAMDE